MSKVGVKLGFTLKLTNNNDFQFIRPEISIEEIDTEKELKPQLDEALIAIRATFDATNQAMNEKVIAEMPNVSKEMEALVIKRMKEFRARLESIESQMQTLIKKEDVK